MKSAYVEGHGCSLNLGQTEKIRALLSKKFSLVSSPENADFIVINTCAVKTATENSMLRRIRALGSIARANNSKLVVCGCLPLVSRDKVLGVFPQAKLFGVELSELASFFGVAFPESELFVENTRSNPLIAIIPIASGCLGSCTYCCVKNARGSLKSFPVDAIKEAFAGAVETAREVWLTSNDNGCYGFDIGSSLPGLLESLLSVKGSYRVRVGMMNPWHVKGFFPALLGAMGDRRVYRFLHLPVQSGSDNVLALMERHYTVQEFKSLVGMARKRFPDMTISTDIIAGFPGETEEDFLCSLDLVKELGFDIVNVSRFGFRPGTKALEMSGRVPGAEVKRRTRILSLEARSMGLERNKSFVGSEQEVLITGPGKKGGFIGRTQSYKPVLVEQALPGAFLRVKIVRAEQGYLVGKPLD